MNKNKLRLLLMIPLTIIAAVLVYVYLPSISYALNQGLEDVGAITVPANAPETKEQIHEHRGYSIYANRSATESVSYENAAGNTGITNINGYLSEYMNDAYDWNLGWYFSLELNTSIFCQEKGTPFPNLNNKYLELFHTGNFDTNELTVGAKHDDYLELWENIACTSNPVTALEEDYPDDGIEPKTKEVYEADITSQGKMISYYQFTLVRVNYKASARVFDTIESYIFTYSLRNYYKNNPAQVAIWKYKNNKEVTEGYSGATAKANGEKLYKAAKAVDELKNPTKPEMSVTTDNTAVKKTGTVLDDKGENYRVGPIYMNQYTYGYSEHIKDFSGDSALKNPNNADMISRMDAAQKATFQGIICGIVEAKVELDNGKIIYLDADNFEYSEQDSGQLTFANDYYESPARKGYQFPTPNSKFYIKLPITECTGATYIKEISMRYKWTTADGNGGDLDGTYDELQWTNKWDGSKFTHATYHCDNTYEGYDCVNDNLEWSDRSTFPGDTFHGNVNKHAHDFWCGKGNTHCQYGSKADVTGYSHIGTPEKMSSSCEWSWNCGKTAHKHGVDLGGKQVHSSCNTSGCKHRHNSSYGVGSCCNKSLHTHNISNCNIVCKHKDCTDDYCEEDSTANKPVGCDHTHKGSCCSKTAHRHGDGNCNTSGCYHVHNSTDGTGSCCSYEEHNHHTSRCNRKHDCTKNYCIHGHADGKHKGEHSWSWATHIHECKGPDGVGTRCNCHRDADGGGHRNCYMFSWECIKETPDIHSQRLMYVSDAQVYEHNMECYIGNIPLVARVEINKYIYDVDHAVSLGVDNTYAASDARADLSGGQGSTDKEKQAASEQAKKDYPVYVEYGDLVTYKIVLKNYSEFGVKVRIDDVLPTGNYVFKQACMGNKDIGTVEDLRKTIVSIAGESEASFTVTIQVEDLEGTYENLAKIITRNGSTKNENSDDVDYVRTVDDDGPVVNHADVKCNGTTEIPRIESRDYYTLNNYNAFVDKYLYKYDQLMQDENNRNGYTQETSIVNAENELLISRENTTETMADYVDPKDAFKLTDQRRTDNGAKEEYKKNHPVSVEKYETVTYAIKVSNDATPVEREEATGIKYATQVRPSEVVDRMHKGLVVTDVDGRIYQGDTVVQDSLGVNWSGPVDDGEFNKYTITLDNETILEPGQYMLFLVEAQVIQSNMYLPSMENKAELTKVTNINNKDTGSDPERDVSDRNIAEHRETSEFIRMKDLIIAGKVWVDFDRDGLMNDSSDSNRNKQYGLIDVNANAMKGNILVSLYKKGSSTPIRTTVTDSNGFFTFGRSDNSNGYHATFNYNNQYSSTTTYQRVDKATGKDGNGNYGSGSQYIEYYIQYEYDGVVYKSTEVYAGMDNLSDANDGTYNTEYLIDSNAAERPADRESFNQKYKYVSYNIMRDQNNVAQPDGVLSFNKEGHISTLDESKSRKMVATSFIDLGTNNINYLWLFDFNSANSEEIPETEYLKYINLGLELREDVDIALFKDVYSVTTLIDGEEIEYAFNQKSGINGEEGNDNYMITNPYGLELYEADYKKRVDQYISEAVRDYKGLGSELNINVTYRITLNNVPTVDDKYLPECKTDEKLDVRIHEILDLYDQNFKTYSDTETVEVKVTDENGFLMSENRKISEAWFFKEGASGTKYKKVTTDTGEPIYVEDPAGTYGKVPLIVSNTSEYSNKANSFLDNGYKTMYIRTANETDIVLGEGEEFDIYVKYTLDKDKAEVTIDTETFEDTKTSDTSVVIGGTEYPMSVSTTTTTTTLERSLKIAEDVENKLNPKGIENIAQVNAYSVYYEDGDPAALVDVDSNAGNIGVGEGRNNTNEGNCDDKDLYEDMTYKTGIQIIANNTENTINDIPTGEGSVIDFSQKDIKRDIKGKVWDDSKTETKAVEGEDGATIFYADGRSDTSSDKLKAAESFEVKTNENVKMNYDLATTNAQKNEKADLPIRNVKVEFIEIVKLPNGRYYEQLLRNVTWEQEQQVRSDENGEYLLRGLTPGDYVVRFTYGDTISDDEPHVTNVEEAREDMRIFNGQDYKSTKYTLALADDETDVDTIIQSFNEAGTSDARDDEMRRLTVNKYSEVMTNQKAEILKGLINDETSSISNRYNPLSKNSEEDLTELTDKTHMYAETIEFTLKPEKFKGPQITKYIRYGLEEDGGIYYNVQTIVANEDINERDYIIENLDFGIEYRPESQISLTKEINQMKLTAEDGTVLVDLYFYTEGEGKDTVHKIDKDKSKGLDVVQFVTNQYTDKATKVQALVNKIVEEQVQGFVYVQVDDEILQGATVEITYKFFAQNNSELDMIRDVLDEIRYKENKQTVALIDKYRAQGHNILDEDYTASGTAENALLTELYGLDENAVKTLGANYTINDYIDLVDRLESTDNPIDKASLEQEKANIIANYLYRKGPKTMTKSGDDGYYGRYVGYGYYTGYTYPTGSGLDKKDVVACLKFDKILDYIDTNLEYTQETNNEKLENRFWVVTDAEDLNDHVYALRNKQLELVNVNGTEEDEVKKITNVKGQVYNSLVVSVDDSLFDDTAERRPANADPNRVVLNKNLSRFLLPYLADKTADKTQSKAYIYLPTSKVIAAETDTDDLQYENIAEIIQFTTVTGRRTNFETTIGNANVHAIDKTPGGPNIGSEEFETASFEPDTAATETITLTPPTGLMLSRRAIVNVVETTTKGLGITAIAAAVVGIVFAVTTVTRLIIKKRRIK